jgi:transcriptional regulator with XRE-family HTH domain
MSKESRVDSYLKAVGLKIKALRKERGCTLADLGENIGLDKSNSFRLEQGKNITLITLIKIAAFLGVHPKDIIEVPFEADFAQIEKVIAEKKKARKPTQSRKPDIIASNNASLKSTRLYAASNLPTSKAAEKNVRTSRK